MINIVLVVSTTYGWRSRNNWKSYVILKAKTDLRSWDCSGQARIFPQGRKQNANNGIKGASTPHVSDSFDSARRRCAGYSKNPSARHSVQRGRQHGPGLSHDRMEGIYGGRWDYDYDQLVEDTDRSGRSPHGFGPERKCDAIGHDLPCDVLCSIMERALSKTGFCLRARRQSL